MSEPLIQFLRLTLPDEIAAALEAHIVNLENANFASIFEDPLCHELLNHDVQNATYGVAKPWNDHIFERLEVLLAKRDEAGNNDIACSPKFKQHFLIFLSWLDYGGWTH